jgi:hypothetical protein
MRINTEEIIAIPNYSLPSQINPNMSLLPRYRLPVPVPALREHVGTGPSAPPLELCLDLCVPTLDKFEGTGGSCGYTPDNAESPATSRSKGSFDWDREKGGFNFEWANLAEFETWHQEEEHIYSIELIASASQSRGVFCSGCQLFFCGHEDSGGRKTYEKKHPKWERKIETKKSGCGCHVVIKLYPHTSTILRCYIAEHDHEIGSANIAYTHLSGTTWERIKTMLSQKIDCHEIVSCQIQKRFSC